MVPWTTISGGKTAEDDKRMKILPENTSDSELEYLGDPAALSTPVASSPLAQAIAREASLDLHLETGGAGAPQPSRQSAGMPDSDRATPLPPSIKSGINEDLSTTAGLLQAAAIVWSLGRRYDGAKTGGHVGEEGDEVSPMVMAASLEVLEALKLIVKNSPLECFLRGVGELTTNVGPDLPNLTTSPPAEEGEALTTGIGTNLPDSVTSHPAALGEAFRRQCLAGVYRLIMDAARFNAKANEGAMDDMRALNTTLMQATN
ncbi:hypothetical protein DICSQDRAFT_175632 [Dichomitus squalens LYAD-421 SS1]|uniref:Uncharacterized protein n=1 Tax=Dichomitus squalens (strain LYAD-421) TaxID=732165 RepID=R7SJ23_DICSQ|nr:uncharacterized protein DICSQDRAFT_175632 [Dichomitus squalens LYAD-421 SS1]EJF55685.1 hypothetical protein DICSQDRAFT_175632 [Dichomitus squalens LYAD-421 SS1]